MKILLIEDSEHNIEAAKEQLSDHDLTIHTSWKDLMDFYLEDGRFWSSRRVGDLDWWKQFDVVLTDVNIPGMHDSEKSEPIAPIGLPIALRALQAGVEYIGVLTDENHHSGPIPKSLDMWNLGARKQSLFTIGDSVVIIDSGDQIKRDYKLKINTKQWGVMLENLVNRTEPKPFR